MRLRTSGGSSGGLASVVAALAASSGLAACGGGGQEAAAGAAGGAPAGGAAPAGCGVSLPSGPDAPLPELRGTASSGTELRALVFRNLPLAPGEEAKIVWRTTGAGPLRLVAAHPDGTEVGPTNGPTEHLGSSGDRPGDEWGTFFARPKAGGWTVRANRDAGAAGEVVVPVGPAGPTGGRLGS